MKEPYRTPEDVIRAWEEVASKRGYSLNRRFVKKFGRPYYEVAAQSVVISSGRCPCLPRERPHCPCAEMENDVREMGWCYCRVFMDPEWSGEYGVAKK